MRQPLTDDTGTGQQHVCCVAVLPAQLFWDNSTQHEQITFIISCLYKVVRPRCYYTHTAKHLEVGLEFALFMGRLVCMCMRLSEKTGPAPKECLCACLVALKVEQSLVLHELAHVRRLG